VSHWRHPLGASVADKLSAMTGPMHHSTQSPSLAPQVPPPLIDLGELMRSPMRQVPAVSSLVAINLLVFVVMLFYGAGLWHTSNGVQLAWGANFGPATQDGQWWRLLSAMFIHFGAVHLVLNMWALWDVGRLLERLLGPLRVVGLYLGAGAAGNLLSLVVQGNQAVSGGASGAIFGLYGALLVGLWRERAQVEQGEFRWLFGGAFAFTVLMLGLGFVVPGIDNAAHGGGLLAGALLGRVLAKPWAVGNPPSVLAGWRGRWLAAGLLVLGVALLVARLPAPSYRFSEELRAQQAIAQFLTEDQRISQQWSAMVQAGPRQGLSFDALAGRVDEDVAARYERSFEQLLAASPDSAIPSAQKLESLQAYASQRAEDARDLAEKLRRTAPHKGLNKAPPKRPPCVAECAKGNTPP